MNSKQNWDTQQHADTHTPRQNYIYYNAAYQKSSKRDIKINSSSQLLRRISADVHVLKMQCSKKSLPGFSSSSTCSDFKVEKLPLFMVIIFQQFVLHRNTFPTVSITSTQTRLILWNWKQKRMVQHIYRNETKIRELICTNSNTRMEKFAAYEYHHIS